MWPLFRCLLLWFLWCFFVVAVEVAVVVVVVVIVVVVVLVVVVIDIYLKQSNLIHCS